MATPFFHPSKAKAKKPKIPKAIIPLTWSDLYGFNGKLAVTITNAVSTMWCAYLFAGLALISFPTALEGGISTIISWIAQTFLQLVLLSVIMVGQKVSAKASDRRALQTFKDAENILKQQGELREQLKMNTDLTQEIHSCVMKPIKTKKKL